MVESSDIQMMDDDEQVEGAASNHMIQISNLDGSEPSAAKHGTDNFGEDDDEMV